MGPELVIAGWVASTVIKKLIDIVFTYVKDQKNWQLGMKDELERLKKTLPHIQSVLEAVETGHVKDPNPKLQEWMWQFRDAVEEAEDVLDEIEYHLLEDEVMAGKKNKVRIAASRFKEIMLRAIQQDPTLKRLRGSVKKLDEVAAGVEPFLQLVDHRAKKRKQQQKEFMETRETAPFVSTATGAVVGRDEEKDYIITLLLTSNSSDINPSILPVVGMGGLGKTTLAQYVFNDQRVIDYFQPRIWVCVSDVFDATILTKKILEGVTGSSPNAHNFATLQNKLIEELKSKRYLLVLDDVWNDKDSLSWERLFAGLRSEGSGSKVLVTTRLETVGEMMVGMMETFRLQPIKEEQFWPLFKQCVFGNKESRDYHKLQDIGIKIAKKLKGVPLAAKAVGGMLRGRLDDEYWESILEDISSCFKKDANNVMTILHLSYRQLTAPLRSCFAYCCIFSQDHEFRKDILVDMWMAAGLVQQSGKERPEDVGDEYFDDLLKRSFFEIHERSYGYIYYTMHDLLHNLAQIVSDGECLRMAGGNLVEIPNKTVRHLSIETNRLDVIMKISEFKHLRTLHLSCLSNEEFLAASKEEFAASREEVQKLIAATKEELEKLTGLRALHLTIIYPYWLIDDFLNFLGSLLHLRYLNISDSTVGIHDSVYKLYHLQVLEPASFLGKGVCNLRSLRRLDIGHENIAGIGKLTSLNYLEGFCVENKNGCRIEELGEVNELRELSISGLENVDSAESSSKAKLKEKQNLSNLRLKWFHEYNQSDLAEQVLDRLEPHPKHLKKLEIREYPGVRSPVWMENLYLTNLESIYLFECRRWKRLPLLGELPYLRILYLGDIDAVEDFDGGVHEEGILFPQLQELYIKQMPALRRWSSRDEVMLPSTSRQWFPRLKILELRDCPELGELSDRLSIESCSMLLEHNYVAGEEEGKKEGRSHSPVGSLCSLKSLRLESCPKMVNSHMPSSLEELSIYNCCLDDELVLWRCLNGGRGLTSLSSLHIHGEAEQVTSFPPAEVMGQLSSLRELRIGDFPILTSSGLGGLQALSSLQTLVLRKLPALSSMPPLPPSVRTLELVELRALLSMPPLPTSVQTLSVKNCHEELKERTEVRTGPISCISLTYPSGSL